MLILNAMRIIEYHKQFEIIKRTQLSRKNLPDPTDKVNNTISFFLNNCNVPPVFLCQKQFRFYSVSELRRMILHHEETM